MIVSQLYGGMGNQMFQYAFGKYLAQKYQTELFLDCSVLLDRTPRKNFVFRNYDLDIFPINVKIANKEILDNFYSNSTAKKIKRKIFDYKLVNENNQSNKELLDISDNSLLIGYWQNFHLFEQINSLISLDFDLSFDMSEVQKELYYKITETNSVCINYRRTDYISIPGTNSIMGELGKEYYDSCINYIAQKIKNPVFYIFSDDIEWCKINVKINYPTIFVEHQYAGNKFSNYLQLLSVCKHQICPNSTFAWWGAWLNKYPEKIVLVPKQWYSNEELNKTTVNLIPENWIRM